MSYYSSTKAALIGINKSVNILNESNIIANDIAINELVKLTGKHVCSLVEYLEPLISNEKNKNCPTIKNLEKKLKDITELYNEQKNINIDMIYKERIFTKVNKDQQEIINQYEPNNKHKKSQDKIINELLYDIQIQKEIIDKLQVQEGSMHKERYKENIDLQYNNHALNKVNDDHLELINQLHKEKEAFMKFHTDYADKLKNTNNDLNEKYNELETDYETLESELDNIKKNNLKNLDRINNLKEFIIDTCVILHQRTNELNELNNKCIAIAEDRTRIINEYEDFKYNCLLLPGPPPLCRSKAGTPEDSENDNDNDNDSCEDIFKFDEWKIVNKSP